MELSLCQLVVRRASADSDSVSLVGDGSRSQDHGWVLLILHIVPANVVELSLWDQLVDVGRLLNLVDSLANVFIVVLVSDEDLLILGLHHSMGERLTIYGHYEEVVILWKDRLLLSMVQLEEQGNVLAELKEGVLSGDVHGFLALLNHSGVLCNVDASLAEILGLSSLNLSLNVVDAVTSLTNNSSDG